jgi:hypothetical protein
VFLRLLDLAPGDPWLRKMEQDSLLARWFEPDAPFYRMVVEPDILLPAVVRAFRFEMEQFHLEPWYAEVLARLQQNTPLFSKYWTLTEHELLPAGAARATVPVRLAGPHSGALEFRLASEHFTRDSRFRLVYYFPADLVTMQRCAEWAAERSEPGS